MASPSKSVRALSKPLVDRLFAWRKAVNYKWLHRSFMVAAAIPAIGSLVSIVIIAASTVCLFATAPFVPDEVESKIAGILPPFVKVLEGSLVAGCFVLVAHGLLPSDEWEKAIEEELIGEALEEFDRARVQLL
jgi:hypothetical protein